ncbi:MAG TPA: acyltransferase [Porphyromonadaceae bacterium]|nr:acyltransferase [Porphyromonadaceae bacterium]
METTEYNMFDDLRPFRDAEIPEAVESLLSDDAFRRALEGFIRPITWAQFTHTLQQCRTIEDIQRSIVHPLFTGLIDTTTDGCRAEGWEKISDRQSHLFISNHRDIVLDAGLLNILFFRKGFDTTEIAIGDNLLIYPWIRNVVRMNKSFIVKRGVSVRQILDVSKHLSEYVYDTVQRREQSVWIAQREGRAKDSNDKTQHSLLKMFTLYNRSQPLEALKALRIAPLAISYEFDPCDYLKAKEYQLKRDDASYKKTTADDIENMLTGITGYKGRVMFRFGQPINPRLGQLSASLDREAVVTATADLIDREIYRNYSFFPFNYIAYDLLSGSDRFVSEYTAEDKRNFEAYLDKQVGKIDIEHKDEAFLRGKIIEMYGNTVKNRLLANEKQSEDS